MVAQLLPPKDHPTLIRAVQLMISQGRDVELLFAGEGPRRPEYEALVTELGIGQAVRFLDSRPDVPELMGASDVFVLATHTEGLPIVLLEAMAAELPIVATDIPSCRQVLDGGSSGILVAPEDPRRMAAAIGALLDNADLRMRLTRSAGQRVRECYSADSQLHLYAEFLTKNGRRE